MKIISINASLSIQGGADRFFYELNSLLIKHGCEVVTFSCKPPGEIENSTKGDENRQTYFTQQYDAVKGIRNKISTIMRIFYSKKILSDLENVVLQERPQIAHIHNIYHRMPFGILKILKKYNIRILWWLHDYKWICPNHMLFTGGKICERCKGHKFHNAIIFRCQKKSFLESLLLCIFSYVVHLKKYGDFVDLFVSPSQSTADIFRRFNFYANKISVLPHFSYIKSNNKPKISVGEYALYIGRIELNKGLILLIEAFNKVRFPLKIIGNGNAFNMVKRYISQKKLSTIDILGYVRPENLSEYYLNSLFTLCPSIWYEVFGLTILESFSYSKPVIASRIGGIQEIVIHNKNGLLYEPLDVDSLVKCVLYLIKNKDIAVQMGKNGNLLLKEKYSDNNYFNNINTLQCGLFSMSTVSD